MLNKPVCLINVHLYDTDYFYMSTAEDEDHTDAESDDEVDYDTIPDYDRQDIENLFTNLYCYSNLLESIAEDNDNDHFRFLHFIKQVSHGHIHVHHGSPPLTSTPS